MATFTDYTCWQPDVVTATIATEAPTPSMKVLLATHSPLRISAHGGGGTPLSEEEFLAQFLTTPAKEGVRVTPVLGQSGSGKSHLIRWSFARMEKSDDRRIIYLPRLGTSLRDVIAKLVRDEQGPVFDQVRSQMTSLRDGMEPAKLKGRILNALAEALENATADDFLARVLVGERGLTVLLHDPLFREYLLRPGAFIERLAEYALRGRSEDDDDVPPGFTLDDLPLAIGSDRNVTEAAASAQRLFRQIASQPELQSKAIDLLNQHLDVAVMEAAEIGVGTVRSAFMALREHLVGKEIILLIEDFALIQGIQRDLLDAIVEVGLVDGHEKYATVRTMMAVTTGYYGRLDDTFRTRVEASSPVYTVDVTIGDSDGLTDFVGRYLNAARVGADALERTDTAPNACEECPFREECHASFGASSDGYGLYPYNPAALSRAIAITAEPDKRDLFNPRRVLSRVVRGVLIGEADAVARGEFPSPEFLLDDRLRDQDAGPARLPDIPLSLEAAVEARYQEPELSRYVTTFQFWGNRSADVSDGVYSAFSLPRPILDIDDTAPPAGEDEPPTDKPQPGDSPALRRQLEQIDGWSRGDVLPVAIARDIRSLVRTALLADLEWADPLMRAPTAAVLEKAVPGGTQAQRTVSIEGANENLGGVTPLIRFEKSAANAITFQLLLRYAATPRDNLEGLIRLREIVHPYRAEVVRRVIDASEFGPGALEAAAASLIAGAALCGRLPAKPQLPDLVAAAFWRGDEFSRSGELWTDAWRSAESMYVSQRRAVAESLRAALGVAQGTGAVHALDDVRVRQVVKAASARSSAITIDELPEWARPAERARLALAGSVPGQLAAWQAAVTEIRRNVPDGESYSSTVTAVATATELGSTHGFVRAHLPTVQAANQDAKGFDFGSVTRIEAVLVAADDDPAQAHAVVGSADEGDLDRIVRYLMQTAEWLDAGLLVADGTSSGGSVDVDDDIEALLTTWEEIVAPAEEATDGD